MLEPPSEAPPRRSPRAEAAAAIYKRFHARCFWHCPPDLEITEERVPFVFRGLKAHGGREGFRLAAELERMPTTHNAE